MKIESIENRARQLSGSMSHGAACFIACREFGISSEETAALASIVSAGITNKEIASGSGRVRTLAAVASGVGKSARKARALMRSGRYSGNETLNCESGRWEV